MVSREAGASADFQQYLREAEPLLTEVSLTQTPQTRRSQEASGADLTKADPGPETIVVTHLLPAVCPQPRHAVQDV